MNVIKNFLSELVPTHRSTREYKKMAAFGTMMDWCFLLLLFVCLSYCGSCYCERSQTIIDANKHKLSPPLWGGSDSFRVLVNLTNPSPVSKWMFAYYHSSALKAERYEHFPPQYDEMCMGLPNVSPDQQCNVIFSYNGWSYLQLPQLQMCCKCENTFGAVRGDWLMENSTFAGYVRDERTGYDTQHWTKWGQYLNHYYCTNDDKRMPIRFNELWGPQHILKQWDFLVESYKVGEFDYKKLLGPPENCENLCMSDVCKAYRR